MQFKITSAEIINQHLKEKVYEITDIVLPGFCKIQPSRYKSFLIRYRLPNGKVNRITMTSVVKAREEAKRILDQVAIGINPKQRSTLVASIPMLKEFMDKECIPWSKEQSQRLLRMPEL